MNVVCCEDCGKDYANDWTLDMSVPDQIWNWICPSYKNGPDIILCESCILKRLRVVGATVVNIWPDQIDYGIHRPDEWFINGGERGINESE